MRRNSKYTKYLEIEVNLNIILNSKIKCNNHKARKKVLYGRNN